MTKQNQVTIEVGGWELLCEVDYTPEEPQTWDYPGVDEEVCVTKIFLVMPPGFRPLDITDLVSELDEEGTVIDQLVADEIERLRDEEENDGDED